MKRLFSIAAVITAVASLSACSGLNGPISGSEVTVGFATSMSSINTDLAGSVDQRRASSDLANLTTPSFYSIGSDGNLTPNVDFGTVEVINQKPFTVKYLLTGKATWTDGTKVTATDLLLSWAASSNFAGYDFKSSRAENGFRYATEQPLIGDSGLSLTIKFNQPIADYKNALTLPVAAHSIAQLAFSSDKLDAKAAAERVLSAITAPQRDDVKAVAKVYRNAFTLKMAPSKNSALFVSAGAYVITEASKSELTLEANAENSWMPRGRAETIKVKFYDGALNAISALKMGKIDLANLNPNSTNPYSSIVSSLKSAKNVSNKVVASNQIESVVFNQRAGSNFSSGAFGEPGSEAANQAALEARQAFLGVISVSKIRTLIGATQSIQDANSLAFSPDSSYYQASTQDSGVSAYQFADAEKSYNTLQKLGLRVPVRVLFDAGNPRAQTEYSVFADLASQAGFSLSNVSSNNISEALDAGTYDVYLAPHSFLSDQNLSLHQGFYFAKGFPSNAKLLGLVKDYGQAITAVEQATVLKKMDAELIEQAYALPLYQLPSIFASSKKFINTPASADGLSLTSGYASWNLSGQ